VTGTLQLNSDSVTTSGLPMGFACAGNGGYSDIGPGAAVTISDESGKLLAKGSIEGSYAQAGSCVLTFKVFDVPAGAKFYKLEVSHRGEMSYTEAEARSGIQVSLGNSEQKSTPPTVQAAPAPARPSGPVPADRPASVPTYSTPCAATFFNGEFSISAVGSSVTSCAFAEAVRAEYVNQPRRGGKVTIAAYSPVTGETYAMTCTGGDVVTCTGGNDAVIYLY
jgi:hypothetical protein